MKKFKLSRWMLFFFAWNWFAILVFRPSATSLTESRLRRCRCRRRAGPPPPPHCPHPHWLTPALGDLPSGPTLFVTWWTVGGRGRSAFPLTKRFCLVQSRCRRETHRTILVADLTSVVSDRGAGVRWVLNRSRLGQKSLKYAKLRKLRTGPVWANRGSTTEGSTKWKK